MDPQTRAPGWKVRCLKCGFTEDWGKYGIRRGAFGRAYTVGWCPRCRWIRCHAIEKVKQATSETNNGAGLAAGNGHRNAPAHRG